MDHQKVAEGHMEAKRIKQTKHFSRKELPYQIQWFKDQEYFNADVLELSKLEVEQYASIAQEGFNLFERATDQIISANELSFLDIPSEFHKMISDSWNNRKNNPFLLGRFDLNGGLDSETVRIIEFNADTVTTIPETVYFQNIQIKELGDNKVCFNDLKEDLVQQLKELRTSISFEDASFLSTSFGHMEDVTNCNVVGEAAREAGFKTFYANLPDVFFSDDEGLFYKLPNGEFQTIDVWFKVIPWDWMFFEEPDLAKSLENLLANKLVVILNPPYTAIWQNKKFLAYITKYFPNNIIAETYTDKSTLNHWVSKPIYGRIGENIKIEGALRYETKGDYGDQPVIYQQYYKLDRDFKLNYYQAGVFYTHRPSALNFRREDVAIIAEDCEFVSHYIN